MCRCLQITDQYFLLLPWSVTNGFASCNFACFLWQKNKSSFCPVQKRPRSNNLKVRKLKVYYLTTAIHQNPTHGSISSNCMTLEGEIWKFTRFASFSRKALEYFQKIFFDFSLRCKRTGSISKMPRWFPLLCWQMRRTEYNLRRALWKDPLLPRELDQMRCKCQLSMKLFCGCVGLFLCSKAKGGGRKTNGTTERNATLSLSTLSINPLWIESQGLKELFFDMKAN